MSGQLEVEALSPKTSRKVFDYLDEISADPRIPPWPWFGPGVDFVDFSSNEALRTTATVEGEEAERYDAAVLEARGLYLSLLPVSVKARENIVRKQLRPLNDGFPGLLIDPACDEVIALFAGGLVYAQETRTNPLPDEPKRDGKYHDLHDALGYTIVGLGDISDAPPSTGKLIEFKRVGRKFIMQRAPRPAFLPPGARPKSARRRQRDVYP